MSRVCVCVPVYQPLCPPLLCAPTLSHSLSLSLSLSFLPPQCIIEHAPPPPPPLDACADDVLLSGVVVPRWDGLKPGERCTAELVLLVISVATVSSKRQDEVEVPLELESMFEVWGGGLGGGGREGV